MNEENTLPEPNIIINVIILKDGWSAKAERGHDVYEIESIAIGSGFYRKIMPYEKGFMKEHSECRAEILPNGKLNIV